MSILDSLAQGIGPGLHIAAGAMNEHVFDTQNRQDEFAQSQAAEKQKAIATVIMHGMEIGTIPPDVGNRALQQVAPHLAQLGAGPSAQTQEHQFKTQQDKAADAERASLAGDIFTRAGGSGFDPNNPEASLNVTIDPKKAHEQYTEALSTSQFPKNLQLAEQRRKASGVQNDYTSAPPLTKYRIALEHAKKGGDPAQIEMAQHEYDVALAKDENPPERTSQYERIRDGLLALQEKVDKGYKPTQKEINQAQTDTNWLQQQNTMIDPVTQKPFANQRMQIPGGLSVGQGAGQTGLPVNRMPSMEDGRKPIDQGTETDLNKLGSGAFQMSKIVGSFNPSYVGFKFNTFGDLALEAGRRINDSRFQKAAEWHQSYENWVGDVRHDRFGATLTGNEKENFDKYKVNTGDSPEIAKANLQRQVDIYNGARDRKLAAIRASGQNAAQAEALVGPKVSGPNDQVGKSIAITPGNAPKSNPYQSVDEISRAYKSGAINKLQMQDYMDQLHAP